MRPVVTPEEMAAIDRAAPESVDVLIDRAGAAVARVAIEMLGGTYGRRIVILEGKGNNGNDGRAAARRLRSRGVRVVELDAVALPDEVPACDLVIDAAFGTGFRGEWKAPRLAAGMPVLAVDIPSAIDGLTGEVRGEPLTADRTVTFAAMKPGLLLSPGAAFAGEVEVVDIGLDVSTARIHLVDDADVARWYPRRGATAHKWHAAVWVVGGSPGLEGAAVLTCTAAMRAGAGYVRWSSPGEVPTLLKPTEVVGTALPERGWGAEVVEGADRFKVLTIGNGLGLDAGQAEEVRAVVAGSAVPVIVDADALTLLGRTAAEVTSSTTILTPHDGEYERLMGAPPGIDRIDAARRAAAQLGAIVVLKGPVTAVAHPDGRVLLSTAGDARLASLGTGDVLTGVIAALVARGLAPFEAAATGAFIHGRAGALGWRHGLIASDVVALLPAALDLLLSPPSIHEAPHP